MRKLLALTSALLALGVVVNAAAQTQAAPPRLVQSGNGTLWVVVGGQRHAITPVQMPDDVLTAIPEGAAFANGQIGGSGGAAVGNANQGGGQGPAAQPPAGPPTAALSGKKSTQCNVDVRVDAARWAKSWTGVTAKGMLAILTVRATNNGPRPTSPAALFVLKDDRATAYSPAAPDVVAALVPIIEDMGFADPGATITPGQSVRTMLVFDIPADVKTLDLGPSAAACN